MFTPSRLLLALACLSAVHCGAPSTGSDQGSGPGGADVTGVTAVTDETDVTGVTDVTDVTGGIRASGGRHVALARVEGYGNPLTGELWMRTVASGEQAQPGTNGTNGRGGVGVQAHALGYCAQVEGGGANVTLRTRSVPGCEDADMGLGDPDANCTRTDAFLTPFCMLEIDDSGAPDDDTEPLGKGFLGHEAKFDAGGVACAGQIIRNQTGANLKNVYLDYDTFNGDESQRPLPWPYKNAAQTPGSGRGRPSELLGLYSFGDIDNNSEAEVWIFFGNNAATDFTFTGSIYAELEETCANGADDDCDGVVDNNCKTALFGASCYSENDCRSQSCAGESIVSLAGAAAVTSSSLVDDVAGVCNSRCNDGYIDGAEQCEDGNESEGDGCDKDCRFESGFALDDWGPVAWNVAAGPTIDQARALVEDSSGRWLVAGTADQGGTGDLDFSVARLLADGSGLEPGYGSGGVGAQFDFGGQDDVPSCVVVFPDGTAVLAGTVNGGQDLGLAAWDSNGAQDGSVLFNRWGTETLGDCVKVGDRNILLVGSSDPGGQDVRLIMFDGENADIDFGWAVGTNKVSGVGSIEAVSKAQIATDDTDTFTLGSRTFILDTAGDGGGTGDVSIDLSADTTASEVAGTIAAAIFADIGNHGVSAGADGSTINLWHVVTGAASLTENVADAGFTVVEPKGGSVVWDVGSNSVDVANAVALAPDGSIVIGGGVDDSGFVARFSANGELDTAGFNALGTPGYFLYSDAVRDVAVNATHIAAVGNVPASPGFSALLTSAGVQDTNYNGTGQTLLAPNFNEANAVLLDADGDVLVAGYYGPLGATVASYERLTGKLESGFDVDGVFVSSGTGPARDLALSADGTKLLFAASSPDGNGDMFVQALRP